MGSCNTGQEKKTDVNTFSGPSFEGEKRFLSLNAWGRVSGTLCWFARSLFVTLPEQEESEMGHLARCRSGLKGWLKATELSCPGYF